NTTPYDYDQPPAPGKEQGTYMAAATGSFGPDCFFTAIGTAKYLPNPDGSGGKHCTKINVELSGSGPGCAFKHFETAPVVVTGARGPPWRKPPARILLRLRSPRFNCPGAAS